MICLTGFMGSGKSTVGRLLASRLAWRFIDLDEEIEKFSGLKISEIFEQKGEAVFRDIEYNCLTQVLGRAAERDSRVVLALGGGTFSQPRSAAAIREFGPASRQGTSTVTSTVNAPVIWLDCSMEDLLKRCVLMGDRPLFRDEASFRKLYQERLPNYQQADYRIESGGLDPQRVVEQILALDIFDRSAGARRRSNHAEIFDFMRHVRMSQIGMNQTRQMLRKIVIIVVATLFVVVFVALFFAMGARISAAPVAQQGAQPKDKNATQPSKGSAATSSAAPVIFTPDKGKFRILLDGQAVGNEEFEIAPSGGIWMARDTSSLHVGNADVKATGQLKLGADGAPVHYEWSAQSQKKASGSVDFADGVAKSSIEMGGKPMLRSFTFSSPRLAVLDNNLYYQYAVLALLYDWKAGGKQEFPVLIPQDMTPGSISVEAIGQQQVENAKYEVLRVSSPDLEIMLSLDAGHRLMRVDVPASKVTIVRE